MSIQMVDSGRLLLVRWLVPTLPDMQTIVEGARFVHARCGAPILYFGVTDARSEPPSLHFCIESVRFVPDLEQHIGYFALVDLTTGIRGALMRSAISGMLLAARRPGRARVHARLDDALLESGASFAERSELLRLLRQARIELS